MAASNRAAASAVRQETDRLTGTHLRAKFERITPASDEELTVLSQLLNKQMVAIIADPKARGWFKLFQHMDDDRSGRISYRAAPALARTPATTDGSPSPHGPPLPNPQTS